MGTHGHHGPSRRSVACAVLTVSDTRTRDTDTSGQRIQHLLTEAGHRVVAYGILPDEPELIRGRLEEHVADAAVEVVIIDGGTGLAPRDTTYEAVAGRLEKQIDGFGELFRMLSYAEIGAAAMLSRAVAGTIDDTVVVSLPGSSAAVELAMTKLLLPALGHMVGLLRG